MPRLTAKIRTFKPEFFSSADVAKLSPWARLLFLGLMTYADDYGYGWLAPTQLRANLFPNDEVTAGEFSCLVSELHQVGMVTSFSVERYDFYEIPSWEKHQVISRRSNNRNPTRDQATRDTVEWVDLHKCESAHMDIVSTCKCTVATMQLHVMSVLEREREREMEREMDVPSISSKPASKPPESAPLELVLASSPHGDGDKSKDDLFNEFWDKYPRKVRKGAAFAAFNKASKNYKAAQIIDGAAHYAHAVRNKRDKQFIPHPATWLNAHEFISDAATLQNLEDEINAENQRGNGGYGPSINERMADGFASAVEIAGHYTQSGFQIEQPTSQVMS